MSFNIQSLRNVSATIGDECKAKAPDLLKNGAFFTQYFSIVIAGDPFFFVLSYPFQLGRYSRFAESWIDDLSPFAPQTVVKFGDKATSKTPKWKCEISLFNPKSQY